MNVFRVVFYAVVSLNCVIGNFDCFYFDFVVVGVLYFVVCAVFDLLVCFFFQYSLSLLYLNLFFVLCLCTSVCITVEHCC